LLANIKKAYFLAGLSTFLAGLSTFLAGESIATLGESVVTLGESTAALGESVLASVLELLLQAAKAPIASTKKNFFMFKFLLMLIEWFPINTHPIKK